MLRSGSSYEDDAFKRSSQWTSGHGLQELKESLVVRSGYDVVEDGKEE